MLSANYYCNVDMKRIGQTVCIVLAFQIGDTSFGQSSFLFENYLEGGLDAPVFDAAGNRLAGPNYLTVLYGGPVPESLQLASRPFGDSMAPVAFSGVIRGQAGYFFGSGWVEVRNVAPGGIASLQVRAWDARLGASYQEVVSLGFGGYSESNIFQKQGGHPGGGVPGLPEPLIGLESFSLRAVVPEPSATLLFLLGLPWLLWRCWRKRVASLL